MKYWVETRVDIEGAKKERRVIHINLKLQAHTGEYPGRCRPAVSSLTRDRILWQLSLVPTVSKGGMRLLSVRGRKMGIVNIFILILEKENGAQKAV